VRVWPESGLTRTGWRCRAVALALWLWCAAGLLAPSFAAAVPGAFGIALGMQPFTLSYAPLASAVSSDFDAGPAIRAWVDPMFPNGYFGWYVTVTHVMLLPDRPATLYYRWGKAGQWATYTEPLVVPEGKRILYAFAVDEAGRSGDVAEMLFKVDYRSPVSRGNVTLSAGPTSQGVVTVSARRAPTAGPRIIRLGGADRYGTCALVASYNYPAGSTVIVARGDAFPDALAASGLAGIHRAPIVLATRSGLKAEVMGQIDRLGATHAIIVGSAEAVSTTVERQLRDKGLFVERIGGVDRYETATLISRAIVARGGAIGTAYVARGDLFPDSLAMSPAAYTGKVPIMLVRPTALPPTTSRAMTDLHVASVVIAGSVRAVSAEVATRIDALPGMSTPARVEGPDRYGTAAAAADFTVASGLGSYALVGVATGENFPDALCGGAALGERFGVLVLSRRDSLPPAAAAVLEAHGDVLREVQVYGSEVAISGTVWDMLVATVR
jgi:putative cell wall-binding protein